jgi:DNA polymerase III delta subunit
LPSISSKQVRVLSPRAQNWIDVFGLVVFQQLKNAPVHKSMLEVSDWLILAQKQSKALPRARLLRGIQALAEADSKLKSGNRAPRAVLEFLISELTVLSGARN